MLSLFKWIISPFKYFGSTIINSTGIWKKKVSIIIIGLDNSGKTTLLCLLKHDRIAVHEPTQHPNSDQINIGNLKMKCFDMGGHMAARRLWTSYSFNMDAIIFMIDTADFTRIEEARTEFVHIICEHINTPILVLGNKIDINNSCNKQDLESYLDIKEYDKNIKVFMCSIIQRQGITEAFNWLESKL